MIVDNLLQLQKLELDALKQFIDFCESHSLTYYVIGGTLLGAVRHKGFIPWDDDIDVGMPRADYEKFLAIWQGGFPSEYRVQSFHNKEFISFYAKLVNCRYLVTTDNNMNRQEMPVWIDIFPMDRYPNGLIDGWIYTRQILLRGAIFSFSVLSSRVDINKQRPFMEKLIISVAKALKLEKIIDSEKSMADIITKQKKIDGKDTNYIYTIASWHKLLVIQKNVIGKGKKLPFEDIEVNAPENPESYLKSQYGDYMILPPEDKRKGHAILSIRKVEV